MIVNASPLIIFGKINKLELLKKVVKKIVISEEVYRETIVEGEKINAPEAFLIEDFIKQNKIIVKQLNSKWRDKAILLEKTFSQLDKGEAETIALALQEKEQIVLIDEKIARQIARLYSLEPKGSLWVLLKALKEKKISEHELRHIISEITITKFRLSGEIINKFWEEVEKLK